MPKKKIEIKNHILIPKHTKLSDKDKKALLDEYKISLKELPKISNNDPAISSLNLEAGDVIKIVRPSQTAGESIFYRVVIFG